MSAAVRNSFGKTLSFSEQLTNKIHRHTISLVFLKNRIA